MLNSAGYFGAHAPNGSARTQHYVTRIWRKIGFNVLPILAHVRRLGQICPTGFIIKPVKRIVCETVRPWLKNASAKNRISTRDSGWAWASSQISTGWRGLRTPKLTKWWSFSLASADYYWWSSTSRSSPNEPSPNPTNTTKPANPGRFPVWLFEIFDPQLNLVFFQQTNDEASAVEVAANPRTQNVQEPLRDDWPQWDGFQKSEILAVLCRIPQR